MHQVSARAMVEPYLAEQDWRTCLRNAELLLQHKPPIAEQAFLLNAACQCHFALGDYMKGASAGEVAAYLALQADDWDLAGEAIYRTGLCHYYNRTYDQAIQQLRRYFAHESRYSTSGRFKGEVFFIQGCARRAMRQFRAAAELYAGAVDWAKEQGDEARLLLYLRNRIWVLLEARQLTEVESLMAELETLAERHPDQPVHGLHALHERAHLALLQHDHPAAFEQACRVIRESFDHDLYISGTAYLTLHYLARDLDRVQQALHLALAVKRVALRAESPTLDELIGKSLKEMHSLHGAAAILECVGGPGRTRWRKTSRRGRRQSGSSGGVG